MIVFIMILITRPETTSEWIAILGGATGFLGGLSGMFAFLESRSKLKVNQEIPQYFLETENNVQHRLNDAAPMVFVKWLRLINSSSHPVVVYKIELNSVMTTDVSREFKQQSIEYIKNNIIGLENFIVPSQFPICLKPYGYCEGHFAFLEKETRHGHAGNIIGVKHRIDPFTSRDSVFVKLKRLLFKK